MRWLRHGEAVGHLMDYEGSSRVTLREDVARLPVKRHGKYEVHPVQVIPPKTLWHDVETTSPGGTDRRKLGTPLFIDTGHVMTEDHRPIEYSGPV